MARVRRQRVTSLLARLIATAGGVGYSPIAPGTCGTIVAVPIAWWCRDLSTWPNLAVITLVTLIGIAAAGHADRIWQTHDSGRIVIDEVACYLMTVAFVDRSSWWMLAIGFVLFRVLDSVKPPPIRWFEDHVPGGAGVVLDDVAAGIMGAAILAIAS
ncbi:phosphatidylglycerophosphatase A [soil metagenome]